MKLALLVVFALGLVPLTRAAARDPLEWKYKQYFDGLRSELHLSTVQPGFTTDCDWAGPKDGTFAVIADKPDYPEWPCSPFYLWSKTCTGAAQTVVFTKKLYLPGPALDLDASLLSYQQHPLTMQIQVNGRTALSASHDVHKADLRGDERLFKLGINTVTVRATKRKTAEEKCNFARTEYGVLAQISAKFGSDFTTSKPVGTGTSAGFFTGTFTVTNHGPSAATRAGASYSAYTSNLVVEKGPNHAIDMYSRGAKLRDCAYSYSGIVFHRKDYSGYTVSCDLGPLKPGESRTITVHYYYNVPKRGDFSEVWPISWSSGGDLFDPKQGNNGGIRLQSACRPGPCPVPR